jgi:antitoxin CptB
MAIDIHSVRRKRLLHTARYRGFREADILIGGFAEAALPSMSDEELDSFEAILGLNDHDLYAIIVGDTTTPPGLDANLIGRMRAFRPAAKA